MFKQAYQNKEVGAFEAGSLLRDCTLNQNYRKSEEIWPLALEVRFRTSQVLPHVCKGMTAISGQAVGRQNKAKVNMQVLSSETLSKFTFIFYRLLCSLFTGTARKSTV